MRIAKTLAQKLSDLEDHLLLLTGALNGLEAGQGAYLRHIAAELRVLICLSSGTEGLVWRLADQLWVGDDVRLHRVGNVNPRHPLSQGLRYLFLPLRSPGRGDPRLRIRTYSLRHLIKTTEAVFVAGRGVTHEALIKWLAQEVGSAHESDAIRPILAELNATRIANIQPFFYVLHSDAVLTIDVAERVLRLAEADTGYQRQYPSFARPEGTYLREALSVTAPLAAPTIDPIGDDEGTVFFLLNQPDSRWKDPGFGCRFAPLTAGHLTLKATKTPDGFLDLQVTGLFIPNFERRWPPPPIDQKGLSVAVTWKRPEIHVYLNGSLIETITQ